MLHLIQDLLRRGIDEHEFREVDVELASAINTRDGVAESQQCTHVVRQRSYNYVKIYKLYHLI
jgi:hypothetical protein